MCPSVASRGSVGKCNAGAEFVGHIVIGNKFFTEYIPHCHS